MSSTEQNGRNPEIKEQEKERKKRKEKRKKKNKRTGENGDSLDVKKPKLSSIPSDTGTDGSHIEGEWVVPGDKGFLMLYHTAKFVNRVELVSDIIRLLYEYADKLYRTDSEPCYFKEKLVGEAHRAATLIESNISDPCLLTDAMFKVLLTANIDVDVEKLKLLARFIPVHRICTTQCGDIIDSVKAVLEPFFSIEKTDREVNSFEIRFKTAFKREVQNKVKMEVELYIASKDLPEKTEQKSKSKHFICIRSCKDTFTQISEGIAGNICYITLTKNDDLFKGYSITSIFKKKDEKITPISLNTRGFLLLRNHGNHKQIVSDTIQLLNNYADKLYRTDGKTCYFEDKHLSKVGCSPIFIESDIEDPSLLVGAILTDLREGSKDIDVKKMKRLTRFLPVINTCTIEYENIIENVKAVLEPVLAEKPSGTEIGFFTVLLHGRTFEDGTTRTKVTDKIMDFLASKGIQGSLERETDSKYLLSLTTFSNTVKSDEITSEICCITLTKKNDLVKGYHVYKNILKTETENIENKLPGLHSNELFVQNIQKVQTTSDGPNLATEIRGFFVTWETVKQSEVANYHKIVSNIMELLNEYADKIYRVEGRSCYFEHKLIGPVGQSPIFIQTDLDDPAVIADAIFADFKLLSNECSGAKKLDPMLRFLPMNMTCKADSEDIIKNVKALLDLDSVSGKLNIFNKTDVSNASEAVPDKKEYTKLSTFRIDLNKTLSELSHKTQLIKQITEYLALRGVARCKPKTYPDLLIRLRRYGQLCFISLLPNYTLNKGYFVRNFVDEGLVGKMEIDETLETKEADGKMGTESLKTEFIETGSIEVD